MNPIETISDRIRDIFCPVLSDRSILKYNKKGLLIEGPISQSQLQPNSIDLTLANTWKKPLPNDRILHRDTINPSKEVLYEEGEFDYVEIDGERSHKPAKIVQPGEFILMASNEILNIPNGILTFVQGRSSIARLGQQTEQAGLIDAGFRGTITFEVFNETEYPLIFFQGMRVCQLYFFKAQRSMRPYGSDGKGSKYQMQIEATGSRIHQDPELRGVVQICAR